MACHVILYRDITSSIFKMHVDLDFLPLKLRRHVHLANECYKAVTYQRYSLHDFFVPIVRVVDSMTRASASKTYLVPSPRTWSSGPIEYHSKETVNSFEKAYTKYVKDIYVIGENHTFPT